MSGDGPSGGAAFLAVDGPHPRALLIGAAWNQREQAVILTHDGECVALPIGVATALRDALTVAIAIPRRAAELAGPG
jgi:hypothetical protein